MDPRYKKNFKLAIIPMLLAGCGGGGGGTDSVAAPQSITQTPQPVVVAQAPAPVPTPVKIVEAPPPQVAQVPTPAPVQEPTPAPVPTSTTPTSTPTPTPAPAPTTPTKANPTPAPVPGPTPMPVPTPTPAPAPDSNGVVPGTSSLVDRFTKDMPDTTVLGQFHALYVVPKGNTDMKRDQTGEIDHIVNLANDWMYKEIGYTFRFDTYQGRIDVTYLELEHDDTYYDQFGTDKRDMIERELINAGKIHADKRFLMFYEGHDQKSCGDSSNDTNGPYGVTSVLYYGNVVCPFSVHGVYGETFATLVAVHEMLHNVGAVSHNAPGYDGNSHVKDEHDIMKGDYMDPAVEVHIDPSRKNYFNADKLPAGVVNIKDSLYIKKGR